MAYSDVILADSPVGYWRLGESSGGTAVDEIGTNDGTYNGSPTLGASGAIADGDTAVTFDRFSSQYISVPHDASLNLGTGAQAIEFWVRPGPNSAVTSWMVAKGDQTLGCYINSSGTVYAALYNYATMAHSSVNLNLGDTTTWHHIVVAKDATTNFSVYIDGVDVTVVDSSAYGAVNTTTNLFIGASPAPGNYWDGGIDEVAAYAGALSPTRIAAHYAAASGTSGGATLVNSAQNANTGSQTSITVTLGFTPTAGNLLVATIASDKQATAYTVSGYSTAEAWYSTSTSGGIFYKVSDGTETSVVFSQTGTSTNGITAWVGEFSGVDTLDQHTHAGDETTVNARSTGTTGTTAAADELAIAIDTLDTWSSVTGAHSFSNGFTEEVFVTTSSGGPPGLAVGYKVLSSTQTVETTWTYTGTADQNFAGVATFYAASPPATTDYYIAPTGNDTTGDGSIGSPWATVQKFIDQNPAAGSTLYCRGGTYTDQAMSSTGHYSSGNGNLLGESGSPITICNYPDETPVFTQTSGTVAWLGLTPAYGDASDGARYVVIDGLRFTNYRPSSSGIIYCGAWSNGYYVHHITIRNCYFQLRTGSTSNDHGVYFSRGSQYVTVEDCIFDGPWKTDGSGGGALHLYTDNGNASSKDLVIQRNAVDGWLFGVMIWDDNTTKQATGSILHNTFVGCDHNLDLRYHFTLLVRDNAGESGASASLYDPTNSGYTTADHNYWGETITAAPEYGLTAGSSAIGGAYDGSDAGWVAFAAAASVFDIAMRDNGTGTFDVALSSGGVTEVPGSFSADAILKRPQTGSFTSDAVITVPATTVPGDFTANATHLKTWFFGLAIHDMTVTGTADLGASHAPRAVCIDSADTYVYVANGTANTVEQIRPSDMTVTGTASLGANHSPRGVCIDSSNTYLYVTNWTANTVEQIRISDMTVTGTASLGASHSPFDVCIDSTDTYVYVSNNLANTVEQIQISSMTVTGTADLGSGGPYAICIDSTDTYVYVPCYTANTVRRIRLSDMTVTDTASLGANHGPYGVCIDSSNAYVYVANLLANTVEQIRISDMTVTGTASLGASHGPYAICIDSTDTYVYVTNLTANNVEQIQISSMTVTGTADLGANHSPSGVCIDSSNAYVYVSNNLANTVEQIRLSPIPDGLGPTLDAVLLKTQETGKTFTADAVIVAAGAETKTGSFSADAVIEKTQAGSFSANAVVAKTQTGSLAANAVVFRSQSSTLTADAVVQRSVATALTADAVVKQSSTSAFTADAVILRTVSVIGQLGDPGVNTLDAWIVIGLETHEGSFTADAVIKAVASGSLTADAVIKRTQTGSFAADAVVRTTPSSTMTANATIRGTRAGSVPADAIWLRTYKFGKAGQ